MRILGIDHINIRTTDLERLCAFYVDLLGLEVGERPPFRSPGAWLYAGGRALLHVSVATRPATGDTQPVDHYALSLLGLEETLQRLDGAGVGYRRYEVPQRHMTQVFVRDPDGVLVELNFSDPADVGGPAPAAER